MKMKKLLSIVFLTVSTSLFAQYNNNDEISNFGRINLGIQ